MNEPTVALPSMPFPMVHATVAALRDRCATLRARMRLDENTHAAQLKTGQLLTAKQEARYADMKYQLKQTSDALNLFVQLRPPA